MIDDLPGLNPVRLAGLVQDAITRCELDLSGAVVLTEAATGAYVVTPVLAAMAGADHVFAVARESRHGSVDWVASVTRKLAQVAGVPDRVELVFEKGASMIASADIVTNSGHVRPIDGAMVDLMKPGAVIPLMYEAWEFRIADIDLDACRRRGIRVTGTNERHPSVDVFSFLGIMAVKLLLDAGVAVYRSRVLVLCDNPFEPFITNGLRSAGATAESVSSLGDVRGREFDAVLIATHPSASDRIGAAGLGRIAESWPGAVVAVFWGDVDRAALARMGLRAWPETAPPAGHMGILPSGVGPEPIVRLQSGSLKAAEALWRHAHEPSHPDHAFGEPL